MALVCRWLYFWNFFIRFIIHLRPPQYLARPHNKFLVTALLLGRATITCATQGQDQNGNYSTVLIMGRVRKCRVKVSVFVYWTKYLPRIEYDPLYDSYDPTSSDFLAWLKLISYQCAPLICYNSSELKKWYRYGISLFKSYIIKSYS